MSCWPATVENAMTSGNMLSKLNDKISSLVCGFSLPKTNDGGYFQLSPSSPDKPHRPCRSSSSVSTQDTAPAVNNEYGEDEGDESSVRAISAPRVGFPAELTVEEATAAPCLAFPSQHGYKVISLADNCPIDDGKVRLRPVLGRRLVPSPYGGTVLATDVCYRHPCHLVDPFTGKVSPLPDLPIPRSETEPVPCARDEPRHQCARVTDDGLAWDWSPHGVMVARGDTAFFCARNGGEWTPVHQSCRGSQMTVNQRGGRFFLFEVRWMRTTVIDAATLRVCAVIPPPPDVEDIDDAHLAPSADGALLLVHRTGDRRTIFTEAYRAELPQHRSDGRPPKWKQVHDIGDRAVFIDGAHGFTARAGPRVLRNHVYTTLSFQVDGRPAAEYDVALIDLKRPERQERMKLITGEVERVWGWQPYWIIAKHGRQIREDEQ